MSVTLSVLELNDIALLLGDGSGASVRSPGFATLTRDAVVTGAAALAQARLNPRQTVSQFWLRLGTEPLHNARSHARHHADLAWAQLQQLAAAAGNPAELILAVPGSFTREQLAVLLGIAQRASFRAVGLVDAALAAASAEHVPRSALHLDLQLHQCVLTRLVRDGDMLARERVHTVPGAGLLQLQERWAQLVTARFIQHSRFDPMHAAATEQQLYDRLPAWMAALEEGEDVHAELRNGTASYHAKLGIGEVLEASQPVYAQILDAVQRERHGAVLLCSARLASLPRLARLLPQAIRLPEDAAIRACLRHAALIRCEDAALRFVTRLPAVAEATIVPGAAPAPLPASAASAAGDEAAPAPAADVPSHLVAGARALRLAPGSLYLGAGAQGWTLTRRLPPDLAGTLGWDGARWWLMPAAGLALELDGEPVRSATVLRAGQRLALPARRAELWAVAETPVPDDGA
jgi:hypothetical protein